MWEPCQVSESKGVRVTGERSSGKPETVGLHRWRVAGGEKGRVRGMGLGGSGWVSGGTGGRARKVVRSMRVGAGLMVDRFLCATVGSQTVSWAGTALVKHWKSGTPLYRM